MHDQPRLDGGADLNERETVRTCAIITGAHVGSPRLRAQSRRAEAPVADAGIWLRPCVLDSLRDRDGVRPGALREGGQGLTGKSQHVAFVHTTDFVANAINQYAAQGPDSDGEGTICPFDRGDHPGRMSQPHRGSAASAPCSVATWPVDARRRTKFEIVACASPVARDSSACGRGNYA